MRYVLFVLLAGCRAKAGDGAPCSTVAGRFYTLARADLDRAQVEARLRRDVLDQLPAMRDALDQVCVDGKWSGAVRDCMVKAEDHVALEACERQLTDAQRAALDGATTGAEGAAGRDR
jgi:hypothetical protein